jgi:hypothetical protein
MKNLLAVATGLALLSVLSCAQSAAQASGKQVFTGVVTDTVCGSKHMMKTMTDAECTRMCVSHGGDYALEVGTKIYTLKGNAEEIGKVAGSKVKVSGTLTGDTITAESITAIFHK